MVLERPPLMEGMLRFISNMGMAESFNRKLKVKMDESKADDYTPHPALSERVPQTWRGTSPQPIR